MTSYVATDFADWHRRSYRSDRNQDYRHSSAEICDICGKRRGVGNNVSHANNKTKRTWQPNLQKVRAVVGKTHRRVRACTRCIRSGKVTKAA